MKFAQLAEYSVKNAENEEWRLVTDLSFFFFQKSFKWVKTKLSAP